MKRLAFATAALLLFSDSANACAIIEGWPGSWVDDADVIVRARAVEPRDRTMSEAGIREARMFGYLRADHRMSTVRFELIETLKGKPPSALEFDGELGSWGDAGNRPALRTGVRPDFAYSTCYAHGYRRGAEYLLMLRAENGALTPYWAASAATNEDISGDRDPWLLWVRDRLELQASGFAGTVPAPCDPNMDLKPESQCRFKVESTPYALNGRGTLTREYRHSAQLPLRDGMTLHDLDFAALGGDLLLVYEVSDAHTGAGEMVRLDAKTLAVKWRLTIPAFNVSLATIERDRAYLGGIGLVAAVDLQTGTFLWKHGGLYDQRRFSFNAFARPVIGPTHVTFVESRSDAWTPSRIVVDKTTGEMRIEAPPQFPEHTAACADSRFIPALESIRRTIREQNTPSVAIAVAERGRVVCEAAFGWADIKGRIPATPSTMYSLASISKPFTATALMRLVEDKNVDLRRPANAYLGKGKLRAYEGTEDAATVERLLTHTAGLPLHYQFFYHGGPPVPPMDDAIARYGVIVYPPGERFVYSNFGFGVLERIVERAGGGTYADVLTRTVLAPLGLKNTMVSDGAGLDGSRAAFRYGNDREPVAPYTFDHVGASGVWSSARDLVRFGMFHLGRDIDGGKPPLSRATRRAMQRAVAPADGPGRSRGLGWAVVEDAGGHRQVSHTGSMPGVSTMLTLYPDRDTAIVVLTNISNSQATAGMERALRGAVLPPPTAARENDAASNQAPNQAPSAKLASAIGGEWSGGIHLPAETVKVYLRVGDDDVAMLKIGDEPEAPLEGARLSNGVITGRTAVRLIGPDAAPADRRMENRTTLTLVRRGDRLSGWVSSISSANPPYGAVSFPIQLSKR